MGTSFAHDDPSHGSRRTSDPLTEPRPAERLAIEPIVWLTTAGPRRPSQSGMVSQDAPSPLSGQTDIPKHSMCEDLLGSCADNHLVCQWSVYEQGGP